MRSAAVSSGKQSISKKGIQTCRAVLFYFESCLEILPSMKVLVLTRGCQQWIVQSMEMLAKHFIINPKPIKPPCCIFVDMDRSQRQAFLRLKFVSRKCGRQKLSWQLVPTTSRNLGQVCSARLPNVPAPTLPFTSAFVTFCPSSQFAKLKDMDLV